MGSSPRFFFALTTLLRFSLNIGFFERPLAIGALWGLLTGEWGLAASLAIFFELLWLDLFPAGTYIPPNAGASMLLTLGVARYFGIDQASLLAVPMVISLPASMLSSKMEYLQRHMQNKSYNRILQWARMPRSANEPGNVIAFSLLQQALFHAMFFSVALLVLIGTIKVMYWYIGHLPSIARVTWLHLWFFAAIGGVLSLRVRAAYLVFLACLAVSVVVLSVS